MPPSEPSPVNSGREAASLTSRETGENAFTVSMSVRKKHEKFDTQIRLPRRNWAQKNGLAAFLLILDAEEVEKGQTQKKDTGSPSFYPPIKAQKREHVQMSELISLDLGPDSGVINLLL